MWWDNLKGHIDHDFLFNVKQERENWLERESAFKYKNILKEIENLEDDKIEEIAKELIPWRKGPFNLKGLEIDSEWRSNLKWDRIKDYLPNLKDKVVLDIGCNNGFYMFQMSKFDPKLILGIDPVLHYKTQFEFVKKILNFKNLEFELFGVEHLNCFKEVFDVVFSMGIIYHHRNPMQQLIDIRESMREGGTLIIESLGIPGRDSIALYPEDRYAKMRNVWFVPTLTCLINWVKRAKFIDVEVISESITDLNEQRITKWCPPPHQSLQDFLDLNDKSKTVEGYPAPMRFALKTKKK